MEELTSAVEVHQFWAYAVSAIAVPSIEGDQGTQTLAFRVLIPGRCLPSKTRRLRMYTRRFDSALAAELGVFSTTLSDELTTQDQWRCSWTT